MTALATAGIALLGFLAVTNPAVGGWAMSMPALGLAIVALAGIRWRRHPRFGYVGCAGAAGSLAATVFHRGPIDESTTNWVILELAALLVLVVLAVRSAPDRVAIAVGVLSLLAAGAQPLRVMLWSPPAPDLVEAVVVCGFWLGLTGLVIAIACYLRVLDRRRERAVSDVRRSQRLALARDLHDLVGHDVTGMVLEAQATRAEGDPERAMAALEIIEKAGLEALAAMDRTVRMLREVDGPAAAEPPVRAYGIDDLDELTSRFTTTGRVPAQLDLTAPPAGTVGREVGDTIYRLVAEALTNVRRHAPAAGEVQVAVVDTKQAIEVSVTDRPARESPKSVVSKSAPPQLDRVDGAGGFGLIGLAARIEALGGTFAAGPYDRGWRLTATLPRSD